MLIFLMLRLLLSKAHGCKAFCRPPKPCHAGIHWYALAEYSQMSTNVLGFQSFLRFFASFYNGQISHQQHESKECYFLATAESWSLIFPSPSSIVSRVSLDSSTFTPDTWGTLSTLSGVSSNWNKRENKNTDIDISNHYISNPYTKWCLLKLK